MKEQDIIKAVAELDGFENVDIYIKGGPIPFCVSVLQGTRDGLGESQDTLGREMFVIPPYLTSRDAIVSVIEKLILSEPINADKVENFWNHLNDVTDFFETGGHIWMLKATPIQICEALLRATGKWK